jgi:N-acetylmuramoyl-L-alanine amidase
VVLHGTGSSARSAEAWLTNPKSGVSAHYLVSKSGEVVRMADPFRETTWHAGSSTGPEGKGVNAYSVGIELENANTGKDPYTKAQLDAIAGLLRDLRSSIHSLVWLTTHREICLPPGRKTDPVGLDWEPLADASGLAPWRRRGQ